MRAATYITAEKRAEQERIAADVEQFIAQGGSIEKLGDTPFRFNAAGAPAYAKTVKRGPKPKAQKAAEANYEFDESE